MTLAAALSTDGKPTCESLSFNRSHQPMPFCGNGLLLLRRTLAATVAIEKRLLLAWVAICLPNPVITITCSDDNYPC